MRTLISKPGGRGAWGLPPTTIWSRLVDFVLRRRSYVWYGHPNDIKGLRNGDHLFIAADMRAEDLPLGLNLTSVAIDSAQIDTLKIGVVDESPSPSPLATDIIRQAIDKSYPTKQYEAAPGAHAHPGPRSQCLWGVPHYDLGSGAAGFFRRSPAAAAFCMGHLGSSKS